MKDRTFRAIFEMPVAAIKYNLIEICKHNYRNPVYPARGLRMSWDNGEYQSLANPAFNLKVSRVRVTQTTNHLKLSPDVMEMIYSSRVQLKNAVVSDRRSKPLPRPTVEKQARQIIIPVSG
jgi:hypothetical protein